MGTFVGSEPCAWNISVFTVEAKAMIDNETSWGSGHPVGPSFPLDKWISK